MCPTMPCMNASLPSTCQISRCVLVSQVAVGTLHMVLHLLDHALRPTSPGCQCLAATASNNKLSHKSWFHEHTSMDCRHAWSSSLLWGTKHFGWHNAGWFREQTIKVLPYIFSMHDNPHCLEAPDTMVGKVQAGWHAIKHGMHASCVYQIQDRRAVGQQRQGIPLCMAPQWMLCLHAQEGQKKPILPTQLGGFADLKHPYEVWSWVHDSLALLDMQGSVRSFQGVQHVTYACHIPCMCHMRHTKARVRQRAKARAKTRRSRKASHASGLAPSQTSLKTLTPSMILNT